MRTLFLLLFVNFIEFCCHCFRIVNSQNASCPYPEKPRHGFVNVRDDSARYTCQPSYYLLGVALRLCAPTTSTWTDSAPLCAADVAAGMPAFLSSVANASDALYATDLAPLAPSHSFSPGGQNDATCAQTEWESAPWLIVDLLAHYTVNGYNITKLGYIDVQNRRNDSQSLEILVGNSTGDMTLNFICAQYDNVPAESGLYLSGYCINGAVGRYVIVRAVSNNPVNSIKLGLCKVVVMSSAALTAANCASPEHHRMFQSKCYELRSDQEMPWGQADQYCAERNGRLASAQSRTDRDYLTWEIGKKKPDSIGSTVSYWLGLKRVNDQWTTDNGESVKFESWDNYSNSSITTTGFPSKYPQCGSIGSYQPSVLLAVDCETFAGWICEYNVSLCGAPPTPEGVVGHSPVKAYYTVGENVTLNCGKSKMLVVITCLDDGTWTLAQPCHITDSKSCPPLDSISNGNLIQISNHSSTPLVVEYRCKPGYYLKGNSSLICTEEGQWSDEPPTCAVTVQAPLPVSQPLREPAALCPKPGGIDNGTFLLSQDPPKPGAHVLYSCNSGHTLKGASILTCLQSGAWSSVYPHCEKNVPASCVELTVINADVLYLDRGRAPGQRAMVQCRAGFALRGEQLLWCSPSGTWNATPPYCEILTQVLLNGPPTEVILDSQHDTGKTTNNSMNESTWAILVTGLVGAALFVAVIGFGAAFVIIKWRKNNPKPENQVITYQIGQQMSPEQYRSHQISPNSPPSSPQMPVLYTINNSSAVSGQGNFQFTTGYASYQLKPVGSFAYHSSMMRPTKASAQRRRSVGSSSELSGHSGAHESRRSSDPIVVVPQSPITTLLPTPKTDSINSATKPHLNDSEHNQKSGIRGASEHFAHPVFDSRGKSSKESAMKSASSDKGVPNDDDHESPPVSPLVIRSGYSSPIEKVNTPSISQSVSPSPEDGPKFSVHISASSTPGAKSDSSSGSTGGLDNPAFVLEEIVAPETVEATESNSRRNSSSSSYLGGSSSDGSCGEGRILDHQLVDKIEQPEVITAQPLLVVKPHAPVKRKSQFSVKDLQDEIRSLPLFQKIKKNLAEEEALTSLPNTVTTGNNQQYKRTIPSSPSRDPKSMLPSVPLKKDHLITRADFTDNDSSTPLAFLDEQFAENGGVCFYEETSSDDVMYEKLAQVESPADRRSYNGRNFHDLKLNSPNRGKAMVVDSCSDPSENTSLDSNQELALSPRHHPRNQPDLLETNIDKYYGPAAQLSDSSLNTSDDQRDQLCTKGFANAGMPVEESSGNEQPSPVSNHTRLRRLYTHPNQRNLDFERDAYSETDGRPEPFDQRELYQKRSPPIMGTKGLRRIPLNVLDRVLEMRNGIEVEHPKSKLVFSDRSQMKSMNPSHQPRNHHQQQQKQQQTQKRTQSPRKYPNSPRLGRSYKSQQQPEQTLRPVPIGQQRSLTDSEDESINQKPKLATSALRSSLGSKKRSDHLHLPQQQQHRQVDKDKKRTKQLKFMENFDGYLPNDEMLLSESFELDKTFLEPVELRHSSGYHTRGQTHTTPRGSNRNPQTVSGQRTTEQKMVLSNKPKPYPRQNQLTSLNVANSSGSKEFDHKRKSNLVMSNNNLSKHVRQSSAVAEQPGTGNPSSVSWDAKKFKHRHKRVQFKDDIDEIVNHHSLEPPISDDEHCQMPSCYHSWRRNLKPTGQRYGVNILSD